MAKSVALAAEASRLSRLASLLLSYIPTDSMRLRRASPAQRLDRVIDRLSHSRALTFGASRLAGYAASGVVVRIGCALLRA